MLGGSRAADGPGQHRRRRLRPVLLRPASYTRPAFAFVVVCYGAFFFSTRELGQASYVQKKPLLVSYRPLAPRAAHATQCAPLECFSGRAGESVSCRSEQIEAEQCQKGAAAAAAAFYRRRHHCVTARLGLLLVLTHGKQCRSMGHPHAYRRGLDRVHGRRRGRPPMARVPKSPSIHLEVGWCGSPRRTRPNAQRRQRSGSSVLALARGADPFHVFRIINLSSGESAHSNDALWRSQQQAGRFPRVSSTCCCDGAQASMHNHSLRTYKAQDGQEGSFSYSPLAYAFLNPRKCSEDDNSGGCHRAVARRGESGRRRPQ